MHFHMFSHTFLMKSQVQGQLDGVFLFNTRAYRVILQSVCSNKILCDTCIKV